MLRHLLVIAVILTGATGCDNVDWGGIEWQLTPPPPTSSDSVSIGAGSRDEDSLSPPLGPLLLAGVRDGSRASLLVVGEVLDRGLGSVGEARDDAARMRALMGEGSRWVLFSEGVRVGSLVADSVGSTADYCFPRPTIGGFVELVPSASEASRLLALPAAQVDGQEYGDFRLLDDVYDQRVATLAWAGDAIPRVGATWPADGLVAARRDIQIFQRPGTDDPMVAVTFLFRDRLEVSPPGEDAYALFFVGERAGGEYREDFTWYRPVETEGKGAPRYFSHLDWDGDGETEVLLEVFGAENRWFAGLGRRDGQWIRTFQDPCGGTPPAGG